MMRISLRSLFLLMAISAVAIASFRHASDGWQTAIVGGTLVVFCIAVIMSIADRGPRRAASVGCAIAMSAYALALLLSAPLGNPISGNREFNPSTGRLPTSILLRHLYEHVAEIGWVDVRTGKPVADLHASPSLNSGDSATTTSGEVPERETFMVVGHAWWALLLGLGGGATARWIYVRRASSRVR